MSNVSGRITSSMKPAKFIPSISMYASLTVPLVNTSQLAAMRAAVRAASWRGFAAVCSPVHASRISGA